MRKIATACAIALALSIIFCTLASAQTTAKHPWASFNKGSWVKMKTTTVITAVKQSTAMESKMTLLDKTPDKVVVETEMSVMGNVSKTKMDIPLKATATAPAGTAAKAPAPKLGSETITIAGKSLACKTAEIETVVAGQKSLSKTWMSEQVPGGLVKSVTTSAATQVTMEIVDFKAL